MTQTAVVVGVDVSKDGLDVALASAGEVQHFANDARGRAQLMKWLKRVGAGLVAYEASGGYERPLALALDRAGLTGARLNPHRVRQFACAAGLLAKSDAIDARAIARFAAVLPPRPTPPEDPGRDRLAALAAARRRLVEDKVRLANQMELVTEPLLRRLAQARLKRIAADILLLDKTMAQAVAQDPGLARRSLTMGRDNGLELWGGPECTVNRIGDTFFDQTVRSGHQVRRGGRQRAAGPHGAMAHGGEHAFDRVRRSQVIPMLGGKVEEGE